MTDYKRLWEKCMDAYKLKKLEEQYITRNIKAQDFIDSRLMLTFTEILREMNIAPPDNIEELEKKYKEVVTKQATERGSAANAIGLVIHRFVQEEMQKNRSGGRRKKKTRRKPIRINPKMRGVFTKKAKRKGMSVQKYAKHIIKKYKGKKKTKRQLKLFRQALFAKTAKKWKKKKTRKKRGGQKKFGNKNELEDLLEEAKNAGLKFEIYSDFTNENPAGTIIIGENNTLWEYEDFYDAPPSPSYHGSDTDEELADQIYHMNYTPEFIFMFSEQQIIRYGPRITFNQFKQGVYKIKLEGEEHFWEFEDPRMNAKGGKRHKKKTRKKRGGWKREWLVDSKGEPYYDCPGKSEGDWRYKEGIVISNVDAVISPLEAQELIIEEMEETENSGDPILVMNHTKNPHAQSFTRSADVMCNANFKPLKKNESMEGSGRKKKTRKKRGRGYEDDVKAALSKDVITNKKCLDIGTRDGLNCLTLLEKGAKSVLGIDLDDSQFKKHEEVNRMVKEEKIILKQQDFFDDNFNEKFDVITCFLWNFGFPKLDQFGEKVVSLLKPGGVFYLGLYDNIYINGDEYLKPVPKRLEEYFKSSIRDWRPTPKWKHQYIWEMRV